MYKIKYLGEQVNLSDFIEIENLSYEEIIERTKKFYEKASKKITKERSEYYEKILKIKPKSIEIVKVNGRWGSCDSMRKITYNYMLSSLSIEQIDYIVVHELCHLLHMNHDRSYWRKVGSVIKDYKKRQEELQNLGGEC